MSDQKQKSQTGLYVGDKIQIPDRYGAGDVRRVEVFRDCLGVFMSEAHREAGVFTPLCDLYGFGSGSIRGYISNFGEYVKDEVAIWAQVPPDTAETE